MLPTGNCSHYGRGGERGRGRGRDERPGRTINREEFKLEGRGIGGGGGVHVKKNRRHSRQKGNTYTHKVQHQPLIFTSSAVLQVSSWVKTKSQNLVRVFLFIYFLSSLVAFCFFFLFGSGGRVPLSAVFTGPAGLQTDRLLDRQAPPDRLRWATAGTGV